MIFRIILGLLVVLIGCSGNQQTSKGELPVNKDSKHPLVLHTGLKIENRVNRGTSYTSSQGRDFNLRYIPITITNDSTVPIHLHIAFSKEYKYPTEYGDKKFKLLLLPKVYALDGVKITTDHEILLDSLQNEFRNNEEDESLYLFNKTLEPGEICVIAISTQYPNPTDGGVLPNALFTQNNIANYQACDDLLSQEKSPIPELTLGLKLDFSPERSQEKCTFIPCGQISYPKQ